MWQKSSPTLFCKVDSYTWSKHTRRRYSPSCILGRLSCLLGKYQQCPPDGRSHSRLNKSTVAKVGSLWRWMPEAASPSTERGSSQALLQHNQAVLPTWMASLARSWTCASQITKVGLRALAGRDATMNFSKRCSIQLGLRRKFSTYNPFVMGNAGISSVFSLTATRINSA